MSKIAIIYICTGNYNIFWNDFYYTCEKNFYPEIMKSYFVFTDCKEIIENKKNNNVYPYFQRKSGWPYDTLMRFNLISSIQDILTDYDYCYFCNANMRFIRKIDSTVIPLPNEHNKLVLWRHTNSYDDEYGNTFYPERNSISTAYVPVGSECHAYGGGFFGGKSDAFLDMARTLRENIIQDLRNGFIAIWHDESHLIKYGITVDCIEVPKNVIMSEEYTKNKEPYAIFLNKEKFGGNGKLRDLNLSTRNLNLYIKIKNLKPFSLLYKLAKKLHLLPVLKMIYRK